MGDERKPGWDKQAVNEIAKAEYGGLKKMFDAHNWDAGGRVISQIAPTKVVESYGSVEAFTKAHEQGVASNCLLNPLAAIHREVPEVWLTSYYGYDPENWGLLAFTREQDRNNFIRDSSPGALVVIYGTKDLEPDEAGRILGVMQLNHSTGDSRKFIAPGSWGEKQEDYPEKWNFAIKSIRAWTVPTEFRPIVDDFLPGTYSISEARTIGRRSKRLTPDDARKILGLKLVETSVYGGGHVDILPPINGDDALTPSKPGPVSQRPYIVQESEGPKHLYMLKMTGKVRHFVGHKRKGKKIVKVGFSVSPDTRKQAFNAALPGNKIKWQMYRSTFEDGLEPFETSKHALAGEAAMKKYLEQNGESLGGEFFLADREHMKRAWKLAVKTAKEWKPS